MPAESTYPRPEPIRDPIVIGGPLAPSEKTMYECGNCGVPRFVHDGILEKCPNCGDDETDLSLIDNVP